MELLEVPASFYDPTSYTSYYPQSRPLQVAKKSILRVYPRSDNLCDGQVVVVDFTDGIKYEVLPAIPQTDYRGRITYRRPDSHSGGRWMGTNPKAEQVAMKAKNAISNGLLLDTCQHM